MDYSPDPAIERQVRDLISRLGLGHISPDRVACVRSRGTKSRRTLARIHTLSKIFQSTLGQRPFYVIEILSENFDRLSPEEQVKTLIHELLHIPHSFGGGFRHHRPHVSRRAVEAMYRQYAGFSRLFPW